MTLRARLALGIVLLVVLATALIWGVTSRAVFRPFASQVFEAFVAQALDVADRVEAGEDPEAIGRQLGLQVELVDRPGRHRAERLRGPGPGRDLPPGFSMLEREGRTLGFPPGPRDRILVRTSRGWVMVHRELDLDRPQRQLRWLLALIGVLVLMVAVFLARAATRPLLTAQMGMDRIAEGDLAHRLPEEGPPELVRVARAFNGMADRIDGLLRTERELMAGMSHELRTPLSRIRLELELLRDEGAADTRVTAMQADMDELEALIAQLLQLSRLQLGDHRIEPAEIHLPDLVDRAVQTAALTSHEVDVVGTGGQVRGDPELLHRVVVNLLQNAGRYAPTGTRVRIGMDGPVLVVEDEGPGVDPDQLPRLFDPFWRAEGSRARHTGGLGLGLMFVRQVVDLHGGSVRAENRVGGGLRVIVSLPSA